MAISPVPKARKREPNSADDFEQYNQTMRARGSALYRELKEKPVDIKPDISATIVWLRAHGVRIRAVLRPEGSLYVLEGVVRDGNYVAHAYPDAKG